MKMSQVRYVIFASRMSNVALIRQALIHIVPLFVSGLYEFSRNSFLLPQYLLLYIAKSMPASNLLFYKDRYE
jgi:hypothetical protein